MKLTVVAYEGGSGNGGCSAIFRSEDGTQYFVKGYLLDDASKAAARPDDGEDVIRVPAEVIERLVAGFSKP